MRTTLIATAVLAFCSACAAGERSVSRQTGDGGASNGSQAASDSGGVAIRFAIESLPPAQFPVSEVVVAFVNGERFEVTRGEGETCFGLGPRIDLDGDAYDELLLAHHLCAGNAIGPWETVISYRGGGTFSESEAVAVDAVERWRGVQSIRTSALVDDSGTEIFQRFVMREGRLVEVERRPIGRELPTLLQVTLQGLLDGAGDSVVVLDLDGDDVRDTLSFATVRAGVMASAWISGRGDVSSDAICERYGVLRTRTGGVRDLACNGNLVLRYDAALSRWK